MSRTNGMPTRDRLLTAARRLFWERGYGSVGVADILRESDTNSGSLYHFFRGKEELLAGVLEQYRDGIGPMLLEPAWQGFDDPIERVFALFASYRQRLIESDFLLGCPIGNTALEIGDPAPAIRQLLLENFDAWTDAVERCLVESDLLSPEVDARNVARFALTTMEGGVMLARAYRDIRLFDQAVASFRAFIGGLMKDAPLPCAARVPSRGSE